MKNINPQLAPYIQFGTFVAIWIGILYMSDPSLRIDLSAIKKLPQAIGFYAVVYVVFARWIWRLPFLQSWLIPFPDLEGTWQGTLRTTWRDPETDMSLGSIPAILVIRQTLTSVNCVLHTEESVSYSSAALLTEDNDNKVKQLSFNYANRPRATVRDRSEQHDGAAILNIISTPNRELRGEYWTNRKTTGEMTFVFKSKHLAESFSLDNG